MLFSAEKEKTAVRRVRFLNRLNYELTFAQRFDIINLWSLPSAIDGKRSKTVACHPARAEWRRVGGSHGKSFPREAIHITSTLLTVLGALGSIASIVSLVLYLHDKKK